MGLIGRGEKGAKGTTGPRGPKGEPSTVELKDYCNSTMITVSIHVPSNRPEVWRRFTPLSIPESFTKTFHIQILNSFENTKQYFLKRILV